MRPFLKFWESSEPQWGPLSTKAKIMEQWWMFLVVVGITQRAEQRLIQEVTENLTRTSSELQVTGASVKVTISDSTIRWRLAAWQISKTKITAEQRRSIGVVSYRKASWWSPRLLARFHVEENAGPSDRDLRLKCTSGSVAGQRFWTHSRNSTPDFGVTKSKSWPESCWDAVAVPVQTPSNVADFQQSCKDKLAKIPPQRCERRIIASDCKCLITVVAAKCGPTSC